MLDPDTNVRTPTPVLADEEIVARVLAGETELFELLVRRHNRRLFRTLRAHVGDAEAAEEALQRAYVAAWRGLDRFERRSSFATWMTRIALRTANELARSERRRRTIVESARDATHVVAFEPADAASTRGELAAALDRAIDALPPSLRVVAVMRLVEGMDTLAVAQALGIAESAVKVRLHRARERLKEDLLAVAEREGVLSETWSFDGERCDRVVARVLEAIRALERREG